MPTERSSQMRFLLTSFSTSSMNGGIISSSRRQRATKSGGRSWIRPPMRQVGDRQAGAAARLQQAVDLLARLEEVPEVGQAAGVDQGRAVADAVVHDARELGEDQSAPTPPSAAPRCPASSRPSGSSRRC